MAPGRADIGSVIRFYEKVEPLHNKSVNETHSATLAILASPGTTASRVPMCFLRRSAFAPARRTSDGSDFGIDIGIERPAASENKMEITSLENSEICRYPVLAAELVVYCIVLF